MTVMDRIRIMFLTGSLCYGGLERVVVNLCRSIDRTVFSPVVVCTDRKGEFGPEVEELGIPVYELHGGRSRRNGYLGWYRVRRIAKENQTHIIHSHNTGPFLDAFLASLFRPTICIHTEHGRSFPGKLRHNIAERLASARAEKVVCVSEELRQNLCSYLGVRKGKTAVINNGIDHFKFNPRIDAAAKKEASGLQGFKHVLGMVSMLRQEKGVEHVIRAAPLILQAHPETGFLVVGDGPIRGELERLAQDLGVRESFVFSGSRDDVHELLQIMDVYILPSLREGLPMALLEAMAARRCILSSAVGEVPQIIGNGSEGVLIPPGEPIIIARSAIDLLRRPELRRQLGERAFQHFLGKYSAETMYAEYEKIYIHAFAKRYATGKTVTN
jgi:glycosyltransferase involved in cell wall biosynthesis